MRLRLVATLLARYGQDRRLAGDTLPHLSLDQRVWVRREIARLLEEDDAATQRRALDMFDRYATQCVNLSDHGLPSHDEIEPLVLILLTARHRYYTFWAVLEMLQLEHCRTGGEKQIICLWRKLSAIVSDEGGQALDDLERLTGGEPE
jgi:hypothetical protein